MNWTPRTLARPRRRTDRPRVAVDDRDGSNSRSAMMSLGRNACSFASQPAWMLAGAVFLTLLSAAGCGHSEGQASNATITLGREGSATEANTRQEASSVVVRASAQNSNSDDTITAADKTAE